MQDKRLILVRNLQQPNLILINGKSLDVTDFHQMISSLGFITMENFQMHRLLVNEIVRLKHFTGNDLWQLVLKMNESEDLIQFIGKKHVS